MKKLFFATLFLGSFFMACSDDDSFYPIKDEVSEESSCSGETKNPQVQRISLLPPVQFPWKHIATVLQNRHGVC